MSKEGEGKGSEQGGNNQPVEQVIVTNSMSDALAGLVKTDTLKEVAKVETAILDKNFTETPVTKEEGGGEGAAAGAGTESAEEKAAAAKAITDKAAADKLAAENKEKADKEAYDKLSPEDKKKADDEKAAAAAKKETPSAFGLNKGKKKDTDLVIEKPEDVLSAVKAKYGQDIKDIKELPKFFEAADKWRADSQNLEKVTKEAHTYKEILSNLPENFIKSIDSYYKGGDWMKEIGNVPKFDFSKGVDKQDSKELVNHYFAGKFTEEDFKEETPSAALQIAIDASKDKFNTEKQARDTARAAQTESATKQLEAHKVSVSGSVKRLKESFPDMIPEAEEGISGILNGGMNEVVKLFYNEDGTCKEEAAKLLMYAKYGEAELMRLMDAASHQTETVVNEDLLSRGADTPGKGTKKGTGAPETISDPAKKLLNEIGELKTKKHF